MAGDELQFIVADIAHSAEVFREEGSNYRSGMPYDGTKCPFGCPPAGAALVDHMLENTLRMIGQVHIEIGQAIEDHGYRLQKAADYYEDEENRTTASIADIFQTAEITPLPPDEPNFH